MGQEGSRAACAAAYPLPTTALLPGRSLWDDAYKSLLWIAFFPSTSFPWRSLIRPHPILWTLPALTELFPVLLSEISHL